MSNRWIVLLIWGCFLARGFFYASVFPVWEGFDEWAHFAVAERMAMRGEVLVWRHAPLTEEIGDSLKLCPIPWELRSFPLPSVTQDAFWQLPEVERSARERAFYSLPLSEQKQDSAGALTAYEALQPPLYYWLMAPALRIFSGISLGSRVVLIRWLSVLIASLAIPLTYRIAAEASLSEYLAAISAALVAAMPEFAIDVARVGNECLGVVLWCLLTWLLLIVYRRGLTRGVSLAWCGALGVTLGCGLLTKAYFLIGIPLAAAVLVIPVWRRPHQRFRQFCLASGSAIAALLISAWWYARNVAQTGTLSGLSEAEMIRGKLDWHGLIQLTSSVRWLSAIDSILFSHIWYGGWSSLGLRSWMYHSFFLLGAISLLGVLRLLRDSNMMLLLAVYGMFWTGQLYNTLLLFASKGASTSMGWYLYAVIAAEAILFVAGLHRIFRPRYRISAAVLSVTPFLILDLYSMHALLIPYYTGLTAHNANGAVRGLSLASVSNLGIGEIVARLIVFKLPLLNAGVIWGAWSVYVISGMTLALLPILALKRQRAGMWKRHAP